jgi:3-methylfumaryl-CoA hydratase
MMLSEDTKWQDWVGRTSVVRDVVTERLVASFRATLSPYVIATDENTAPPGLHWCLAPEIAATPALGRDGHPVTGEFMPLVPPGGRMWASGEVRFIAPLLVNDQVHRRSTIREIRHKQGRSGPLCFITVRHQLQNQLGPVIEEDQVIVYRGAPPRPPATTAATSPALGASHQQEIGVDPVLLFRYSALTFNAHRIHYDFPYATEVEHYTDLVIHGPLQATLLLNLAARIRGCLPHTFSFRNIRVAAGTQRLRLGVTAEHEHGITLEIRTADDAVTMQAVATW